ncbi:MAG: DUF6809 family protein [Dysosmobacter sp.]
MVFSTVSQQKHHLLVNILGKYKLSVTIFKSCGIVCCYREVQHMKTRLKDLYNCFYTPPEFSEQKQEVEECHQALIQVLEKPERRLVLRIIDAQSLMAEERSIDSFISGFELAWQLSMELNQYENERSVSSP